MLNVSAVTFKKPFIHEICEKWIGHGSTLFSTKKGCSVAVLAEQAQNYGSPLDIFLENILAYCTTGVYRIITEVIFGLFGQNVFLIGAIIFHVYFNSIYFNVDIVACAFRVDLKYYVWL